MNNKKVILNPNIYYFARFGNIMIYILYNIYKYLIIDNYDYLTLYIIKTKINEDTYIDFNIFFDNKFVKIINVEESYFDLNNLPNDIEKNDFDFEVTTLNNNLNKFLCYDYNKFINQNIYLSKKYNIINLRLEDYLNELNSERGYKIINQTYLNNLLNNIGYKVSDFILVTNDYDNCNKFFNLNECKSNIFIKEYFIEKGINCSKKQILDFLTVINSNILIASASTFSIIGGILGKNNKIYIPHPYLNNTETEQKLQRNIQHEFLYYNSKCIKTDDNGNIKRELN